jgi:hypothetical protein
VRGAEALDLLKAWGTGHPGGIGTIHAGSAIGALRRLEQLIQEAVVTVPHALIAETINVIAVLAGRGQLVELAAVAGYGLSVPFRQGLSARGLAWALGVPKHQKVYPAGVSLIFPPAGRGRLRKNQIPDQLSVATETMLATERGGKSAGAAASKVL